MSEMDDLQVYDEVTTAMEGCIKYSPIKARIVIYRTNTPVDAHCLHIEEAFV